MHTEKEKVRLEENPATSPITEDALQDSQRFLRTLISNLPGYVYRCQAAEGIWYTQFGSEGIYELTGYFASDFLKGGHMSYSELVESEDRNSVKEAVIKALNEQKPYQITYRIKTAQGTEKWVWEQGRGIYDGSGKVIATEGFITDITGKKLAEEEILKRNQELATLNLIGQSLSRLAGPSEILDLVYKMTGRLFDNKNLYVALYNESTNYISFPIYAVEGTLLQRDSRKFSNGLTEYIIKTKTPLLIKNNKDENLNELGIHQYGEKSMCLMSVPMMSGEKVTGVITLQDYREENKFNESQIELLSTIASQAAIALENSHLYSQLHKDLQQKLEAEKTIKASLHEKEILLQEIHHRVKNNLQIMSSLLRLQATYVTSNEAVNLFRESENRIKSMTIIHNKLYNSKNYERIDFGDYVKTLTDNLFLSYGISKSNIKTKVDIRNIKLNIDTAIPCGLIINELVSNSLKHAFKKSVTGRMNIKLQSDEQNQFTLTVEDDGAGLPKDFDFHTSKTLGMKLVHLLSSQIGGKIQFESNGGTRYAMKFNEVQYKVRTNDEKETL
jgi:PAS domain S-box-containing protein